MTQIILHNKNQKRLKFFVCLKQEQIKMMARSKMILGKKDHSTLLFTFLNDKKQVSFDSRARERALPLSYGSSPSSLTPLL